MIARLLLMSPMAVSVMFASPAAAVEVFAANYNKRVGDVGVRLLYRYGLDR